MARQPSYRPLEPSEFFADGRSSRPLVAGTVARGLPLEDSSLLTGKKPGKAERPQDEYVTTFPIPIDRKALERGRERFTIYCAVCHDDTGNGNGKIVERGYTHPPSYITDHARGFQRRGIKLLLRDAPVGYYFEVIANGYGAMPDYAMQVPPEDRWKIIAYIRALQLSQHARLADLPVEQREQAQKALEGKP